MKQIRKGVFETNSSSSHSLAIRSDAILEELGEAPYFTHDEMIDNLYIDEDGTFGPWNEHECWYFGRAPFTILYSFEQKLKYAYANVVPYSEEDDEEVQKLNALVMELIPEIKHIRFPEQIGVDECCLQGWLREYQIDMREFLTNKKYIVIQDGDEYCIWESFIDSGLLDMKALTNLTKAEELVDARN